MTDELQGLIERIETATRPHYEIDKAIKIALMPDTMKARRQIAGIEFLPPPEPFTSSIDAAKTLIPPPTDDGNYTFAVGDCHEIEYDSWACVTEPPESSVDYWAHAATPALALCAASLRAQKEQANG